jgi:CBS domain-containing protein
MSSPVWTAISTMPIQEAYHLMRRHGVRRLPVVEAGQVVGMVTINDIRQAMPSAFMTMAGPEAAAAMTAAPVAEVMTRPVHCISPDHPVREAARLMRDHQIGGVPVIDADRQLVGIISESDVFRMLIEQEQNILG